MELAFTLTAHKIKPRCQLWRCKCLCPGHRAVTQGLPCRLKPRPLGEQEPQRCWERRGHAENMLSSLGEKRGLE